MAQETKDLNTLLVRLFMAVPLFHELGKEDLLELIPLAQKVPFEAGDIVFNEGDEGESMYVAVSGRFEVYRWDDAQEKVPLAKIEPGEHFGEIALVENVRRTATVRALTPVLALRFTRSALEQRPVLAMKLYRNMTRILAKRLRSTNNEVMCQAKRARQAEKKIQEYEKELSHWAGKLGV
ncbi:CRP-like cAMP-binding protein [Sulfuritortus calidifontis]|uniref:CRP-like cAMP-binding protein n=1 Tax=Sulfuritortus calidifontis TaxID=1914471 RepID=A0A4R3JW61_9PROT|nr:cyclic nucleotide-binding domain-containing protein [Sulfuritortus calidifontis]TCS72379.1 CRP-like cAMP-binding protein [Sulfuritortus calidifontis]